MRFKVSSMLVYISIWLINVAQQIPDASEDLSSVQYPEELVFSGGLVEVSGLFVHEECVRDPHQLDVLGADHKLLQTWNGSHSIA